MITDSDIEAVERVVAMQAVYRMFSVSGRLLYVGVTSNLATRLASHAEKRWFPLVATITLTWYPNRETAEQAERAAIEAEHPWINISGRSAKAPAIVARTLSQMPEGPVSLAEAVGLRILHCTLGAARKAAARPGFPQPVAMRGLARLYDVDALCAYRESRKRR